MNIEDIPKQVVKELALRFQETNDGAVFERILLRVDRLVQWMMHCERRKWQHLRNEDQQDLYQAAMVGMCNGIARIRPDDTPNVAIFKLTAYTKAEIRKEFPANRNKYCTTETLIDDTSVYRDLESECLNEVFHSLIDQGIITDREYNFLCQRYIHAMPWKTIATMAQMNIDSIKQMVYAARNRMRHCLRRRGITGED